MMKRTSLTQDQLKAAMDYDPVTGLFRWIAPRQNIKVGDVVGNFSGRYVRIKFEQKSYPAHCLAWLWMTGSWPKNEIDHRDTDKHNNCWNNLREATRVQNSHNRSVDCDKMYTSLKGVTFAKGRRKWQANIRYNGKLKHIGYFSTAEAAHAAYAERARELFGVYARIA